MTTPNDRTRVCSRWSAQPCPETVGLRRYTNGYFCPAHAPGAVAPPLPDANPLKTAALAYAARGWHVFPITPGGRVSAVTDWPNRATATDTARIARCWEHRPYNIGIACGPSGLVVVDLDMPKSEDDKPKDEWAGEQVSCGADVLAVLAARAGEPFPDHTFTVTTQAGGTHLYFAAPDSLALPSTSGKHGWKVDTRANGGYVIAAGSVRNDRPYTVTRDVPVAPLPDWLFAILRPAPVARRRVPTPVLRDASRYATVAFENECANVESAPDGTRGVTLLRAARALGRFVASGDLPRPMVEDALREKGAAAGMEDARCVAIIRSALNWSIANNQRRGAA
ncbi:bifunctional DNA primase/polymerase [Streptodolium elevatio]|uniref:Bifunctional DNA primase/polymerase n=1 Tax=Streptodolium elevatio TaxID=3157996 RepID=A0ABV3DF15_9ACTN